MAYSDGSSLGSSGARRTGVAVAVAVLHGAAALGIVSAFAGGVMRLLPRHDLPTQVFVPVDPPTQEATVAPTNTPVVRDRPADPAPPPRPIDIGGDTINAFPMPTGPIIEPLPAGGGIDLGPVPSPAPSTSFAPVDARPLGRPGLWVTNNDYPAGAMRRGEQGVTVFRVTVGPDGRVRDCVVTRSSGSAELDRATCAKVSARAKFAPASDGGGNPVAGTYANTIRWEIPN